MIKTRNIKVVNIFDDNNHWTVLQTCKDDVEIGTQYILINENPKRQTDGPYRITKKGLEQMFNQDVTILFSE
jgi:hypothetical protein